MTWREGNKSGRFLILENHLLPAYCRINRGKTENAAFLLGSGRIAAEYPFFPVVSGEKPWCRPPEKVDESERMLTLACGCPHPP